MGQPHDALTDTIRAFIEAQQMFFVATAPLDAAGRLNLSPKGLDTLRVLRPRTIVYLDYVGSGSETVAHVRQNGRIVLMWCAFAGPPSIVRVHGRAEVIEPQDPEYPELGGLFGATGAGVRSIIRIAVERVAETCGFGVPLYDYKSQRSQLTRWAEHKGQPGLVKYQREKNRKSLDGLPSLRWVTADASDDDRR
jgi:Pyridoxamine 5'-phosphate oxidase